MRLAAWTISPLVLFAICAVASAQDEAKTDLQRDALVGPVKSVTSTRLSEASQEQQKKVAFMVVPSCGFCEYDRDGNRITSGRLVDGAFTGDRTVIARRADGLIERVATTDFGPNASATTPGDAVIRRELAGPFGTVELWVSQGKTMVAHETLSYDAQGHLSETRSWDSNGVLASHTLYKWTADGERTELVTNGKGDVLATHLTWDPETDVNRYTCFDPSGALLESWVVHSGKVLSFWQASDGPNRCSHFMLEDNHKGEVIRYQCQKSNACDVSTSYSTYAGSGKENIRHTEFRDQAGKLMWAADYQYEFDSNGNWTHRKISLTIAGEPGPMLYAEDARAITYWEQ